MTVVLAGMLATGATGTAISLSVLAGWQRGGALAERLIWVAIGVVLVMSAHLLPALVRDASRIARGVTAVLWLACMATTVYGHTTFFLLAQQHAGVQRAGTAGLMVEATPDRSLTDVMRERAEVTRLLAFAKAQRCPRDCSSIEGRRETLTARLDALDAEADEVRRHQAVDNRVTVQRDALLADPVTSRLAALLGTTTAQVDLLSGIAFATVLEGAACVLWAIALRPSPVLPPVSTAAVATAAVVAQPEVTTVTAVTPVHGNTPASHASPVDPVTPSPDTPQPAAQPADDDVTRLRQDITAGRVRATVADIRRHLGCSQARAILLRRQIAGPDLPA